MNCRAAARTRARARESGVEIVEDDDEDAAVELAPVAADVGLDRLRLVERRIELLDRNVDEREDGDGLRLALLEDWKSSLVRLRTKLPCWSVTMASIST